MDYSPESLELVDRLLGDSIRTVRPCSEDSLPFFYDGIAPLVARGKSATLI